MDVEALKTFLEVNRTRHFGQAAENLYLSQSAVSARIRLLEEEVGVPLFNRERNNIQLTAAGQQLLRHAQSILNTWHRAKQEIGTNDTSQVPLTIACMPVLWDILLQNWIDYMQQTLPDLILHSEIHDQEVMFRRIKEGTLDLAFCFGQAKTSELEIQEVLQIPLILVSSQPRQNLSTALSDNYMLVDWGETFAYAHAQHFPDMPAARMRLALGRMAKDLLLRRGGSAYLAEQMVSEELRRKKLFRVKDAPVIKRAAYAVYSGESDKQALLQHALKYFSGRDTQNAAAI